MSRGLSLNKKCIFLKWKKNRYCGKVTSVRWIHHCRLVEKVTMLLLGVSRQWNCWSALAESSNLLLSFSCRWSFCSNQQSITYLPELKKNRIITGFIKWCRIVCGKIAHCEEAVDHFKMWKRLTSWVNLERLAGLGWPASGWPTEARRLGLPSVVFLWLLWA